MKIEIGESLLLSYLKNVKGCLLSQTNWKTASSWTIENDNQDEVDFVYNSIKNHKDFSDVFKSSLEQTLKQAEIDVVGINNDKLYLVEVAFHENGLQYGGRLETKDRVCKKLLRAYLIALTYFPQFEYEIIFASPKVNNATEQTIQDYFTVLNKDFSQEGKVSFKYIANDDFKDEILIPTMQSIITDSDSSELFLRSAKMIEIFGLLNLNKDSAKNDEPKYEYVKRSELNLSETDDYAEFVSKFANYKVGEIARNILASVLKTATFSEEEILKLQDARYSKNTFDLQYPLLKKAINKYGPKPERYYSGTILINDSYYFICSEWYANDKPYLIKWLYSYRKLIR